MPRPLERPSAISGYGDWPAYVRSASRHQTSCPATQDLASTLGIPGRAGLPELRVDETTTHDGVTTAAVSWQLGFGPRTRGWLARPAGSTAELPGILALHCHGGNKFGGANRLVAGAHDSDALAAAAQAGHYAGRSMVRELALRGFVVLAHDTFSWGSRRFDLQNPPWRTAAAMAAQEAQWRESGIEPTDGERYNAAAAIHEDTLAKAAGLLGTSLAGMVAHDDLAALDILAAQPGVDASRLGCLGFSGGGGRSLALAALSPRIRSYVVTCMMTTFDALVPAYLDAHSWLLQTPGLWDLDDWPALTHRSTATSFLVQYGMLDPLFPEQGMRDAHELLTTLHQKNPNPGSTGTDSPDGPRTDSSYRGSFWNEGHVFTAGMQDEAYGFLATALGARAPGGPP